MIELRWAVPEHATTERPVLQWRFLVSVNASGSFCPGPAGEWQIVPTVVIPTPPYPRCTKTLQAQGVAYNPRTCAVCGLGPCRALTNEVTK